MEKIEKGLALEELEAHTAELLPDRLEMRKIRNRRKRQFDCTPDIVQIGPHNHVDSDISCFRIS